MAQVRIERGACSMMVKASLPVRHLDLVAPLAHKATAMHTTDTAAAAQAASGAVSTLIGPGLLGGDVDSARSARTPGTRTSTTATRTTTTRARSCVPEPSADPDLFEQLVAAYVDCRRHKRQSASARAFEACLERNLCDLHDELIDGSYRPGRSICFVITKPKPREVWAAHFRDRIVHHLLYNRIAQRFHARFSVESCACIPGRGTLYAAQRLESHVRSCTQNWQHPAHYLKCDLANFFVSIDKRVLLAQVARLVTEPWWMRLAQTILMHDPRDSVELRGHQDLLRLVPPHKSLFNADADHGLPIGNLSSQFFANVLLDDLDQHCKHRLRAKHYVRYVDDFVLLHPSPQWLNAALADLTAWLPATLSVQINPAKTILQPVDRGIDFVGHVVKPWRRITRPRTVRAAHHRVQEVDQCDLHKTANSYFGLLRQASHSHGARADLANLLRRRGRAVKADLTKIYARS
jgi:RNA-directed DNA polymerase